MRKDNGAAELEHCNGDLIGTTATGVRGFDGSKNLIVSDRSEGKQISVVKVGLRVVEDVMEISCS